MIDQAITKTVESQIEMADFIQALRTYRSGEQSLEELVVEIHQILADGQVSAEELLTTLAEEANQSPLPPQVLKTLKQSIEFFAESDLEDDTIVDEHLEGDRQPPKVADHSDESYVPLSNIAERALRQTPASKAGNGDSRKSVGDVLNDRFELVERIATRGMSIVYKAIDRHMLEAEDRDRYVTVKILKRKFQAQVESLLALQQEAKKAQRLEHPNIVKLCGFDQDGDTVYLIMEHLSGESLSQRIGSGGLREKSHRDLLRIINEMGKALAFAHDQGVVHCDFEPANVFLFDNGEVKVLDFGLARVLYRAGKTGGQPVQTGTFGGLTPAYASPEMLESCEPDPRDDVFALACTSYELLTGEHPFQRMRASSARDTGLKVERRGELTRAQWQTFKAALEFDRDKRTPTVNAFLAELKAAEKHSWVFLASAAGTVGVVVFTFGMVGSKYYFEDSETPEPSDFSKFEAPAESADPVQSLSMAGLPIEDQGIQRPAPAPQEVTEEATRAATSAVTVSEVRGEVSLAMERQLQARLGDIQRQQGQSVLEWETKLQAAQQESLRLKEQIEALKQTNREAAKVSETQQAEQQVARLLALAETQFAAKRLTLPVGNNALETYRQVLQVAPDNKVALMGIDRIKTEYQKWASGARKAGNWQRAQANLEKALEVDSQDTALAEALRELKESRKTAEQATHKVETAELAMLTESPEPIEMHTLDLETLMTNARQQLAAERLIQPEGDNAWETFSTILGRDPGNREAQAGLEAIPGRLETLARNKQRQGKLEEGLAIVEDALRAIPGHWGLRALKNDISGQLQAQHSAQEAEQRRESGRTRSDAPKPEQEIPAEQYKRRIRNYGSFF